MPLLVNLFWRGLWTWPPWVICTPACNHKLKEFRTFRGVSGIVFFKKPLMWREELRIGRRKDAETVQLASQFQMADRWIKLLESQLPLDVAQNCSVLVFHLQKFLCWKFRDSILRHKALVYLLSKGCTDICFCRESVVDLHHRTCLRGHNNASIDSHLLGVIAPR